MPQNNYSILGQEENIQILEKAIETNFPILLVGATGTGKTSIVREMALAKKVDLNRINLTGQTTTDEFIGKWLIKNGHTYWQDGILTTSMREGSWILVDEINAALPEILFALHSLLDDDRKILLAEKDGEVVKPHKDFRFFATMNPSDEYAGTKELNKAFLSRFKAVLEFNYPTFEDEVEAIMQHTKVDLATARVIVSVGNALRKSKDEDNDIYYTCSTRDLISWASLIQDTKMDMQLAFKITILNKAFDDKLEVSKIYEATTKQTIAFNGKYKAKTFKQIVDEIEVKERKLETKDKELKKREEQVKATNEDLTNKAKELDTATRELITKIWDTPIADSKFKGNLVKQRKELIRHVEKNRQLYGLDDDQIEYLKDNLEAERFKFEEIIEQYRAKTASQSGEYVADTEDVGF